MDIRCAPLMDSLGTLHMNPSMAERFEPFDQHLDAERSSPFSELPPKSG